MNIKAVWVHRFGPQMATYRYRAEIPAQEVSKLNGFKCGVNEGEADIVIFTKPCAADIDLAIKFKAEGAKIVSDLQDDHFSSPEANVQNVYREMAKLSDALVCATDVMQGRIKQETGKDSVAIPDPYEFDEVEPHANGDNFLWFGHQTNFSALAGVTKLMGERKLRVVIGPKPVPNTIPWSLENMKKAFSMSNIVILPTQEGHEYKSPNRLINSIRQGCFAVCMEHPSYWEFRDYVWVGDFYTGLRWTDAFRDELNERVRAAQDYVRDRYSPQAIGRQWAQFLESL